MKWNEIKESIQNDLLSRGLKNPKIRLNALNNLENIFRDHFPGYLENPKETFGKIDKQDLKHRIAKHKPNQNLNSAESSVINEIYYRIQ